MLRRIVHETVFLSDHVLARRGVRKTHVVEFCPVDKSFVVVRSWNAPTDEIVVPGRNHKNLILVSKRKLKIALARELWTSLRKSCYWIA